MAFIKQFKKQLGNLSNKGGEGLVALKEFNLYPRHPEDDGDRSDKALVDTLLRRPPVSLDDESPPPTVQVEEEEETVGEELDDDRLQAYSHGLEEVYSLENVDVSTVRRLGGEKAPEVMLQPEEVQESVQSSSLSFDFGEKWRGWMPSLVLREPITVLGLPEQVLKNFHDDQRFELGDIYQLTQEDMMGLRLGQGHIDEVRQRLKQYLKGKSLNHARRIDFTSWLRSILADADPKQRYLILEAYGLGTLFPLTPAQTMEIRRMASDVRQKEDELAFNQGITQDHRRRFAAVWRQVMHTFIQPWMGWRHGLATYHELEERLTRLAASGAAARNVLKLFAEIFFKGRLPFSGYLHEVEEGVFATDEVVATHFNEVLDFAQSYFYQCDTVYPLEELVSYIERERARLWSGYEEGFVEKVLKMTKKFRVRRKETGHVVRKNTLYK